MWQISLKRSSKEKGELTDTNLMKLLVMHQSIKGIATIFWLDVSKLSNVLISMIDKLASKEYHW
jgi:hypothetical protein